VRVGKRGIRTGLANVRHGAFSCKRSRVRAATQGPEKVGVGFQIYKCMRMVGCEVNVFVNGRKFEGHADDEK